MDFDVQNWGVEKSASELDSSLFGNIKQETQNKNNIKNKVKNIPKKRKLKTEHVPSNSPVKKLKSDTVKDVVDGPVKVKCSISNDDERKMSKKRKKQLKDRQRKIRKKEMKKGIHDENHIRFDAIKSVNDDSRNMRTENVTEQNVGENNKSKSEVDTSSYKTKTRKLKPKGKIEFSVKENKQKISAPLPNDEKQMLDSDCSKTSSQKKRKRKRNKSKNNNEGTLETSLERRAPVEKMRHNNILSNENKKFRRNSNESIEHNQDQLTAEKHESIGNEKMKKKKKWKKKKNVNRDTLLVDSNNVVTKDLENTNNEHKKNQTLSKNPPSVKSENFNTKMNNKRKSSYNIDALKSVLFKETKHPGAKHDGNMAELQNKNSSVQKGKKVYSEVSESVKKKDKKVVPSLKERMTEQLKAARFRYLNEQLYTQSSQSAFEMFQEDKEAFQVYHDGFQSQVAKWPVNPVDVIIKYIKSKPQSCVVADFGCGDAKISRSVPNKVHSFDLVAVNKHVTVCDMSKVPLKDGSVDIAVFCLSLMGTNLRDYLTEANRVLKKGGVMKIAEVESRFQTTNLSRFIVTVEQFGFQFLEKSKMEWSLQLKTDTKNKMFIMMDFRKCKSPTKSTTPEIQLDPCMYKKR